MSNNTRFDATRSVEAKATSIHRRSVRVAHAQLGWRA